MKKIFKFRSKEKVQNEPWVVIPRISNDKINTQNSRYRNNKIKTTIYTLLTFLPKNLFEQFHRFANVYFLFIIVLNWIPAVNAFGKEIAMIPLIFVLAVTAVKDIIEDRQRYKSDKAVNNRFCSAYDWESKAYMQMKWHVVNVGDILQISNDEIIPADILILKSSDENGICHVSTANLDGENNLKQKQVPRGFVDDDDEESGKRDIMKKYNFQLKCEPPNNQINSFYGSLMHPDKEETGVDKSNLLLRGCVLKNTQYVHGLVVYAGHDTKAMLNSSGPRYKRSRLEKDINKDVIACVFILLLFCLCGAIGCGVWTHDFQAFEVLMSTNEAESPAHEGFLRFWTFIIVLQVIIPISLYVSVEIVKLGQVYFINRDEKLFYEPTKQYPVCRATNINEDLGQIKYVFSDKTGTLTENKMIFNKYSIAGSMAQIHEESESPHLNTTYDLKYERFAQQNDKEVSALWEEFFIALSICNTVVVSVQPDVVDETVETIIDSPTETNAMNGAAIKKHSFDSQFNPRISSIKRRNLSMNNFPPEIVIEGEIDEFEETTSDTNGRSVTFLQPEGGLGSRKYSKSVADRLSRSVESINSWLHYGLTPHYEFESPDEGALVKAAAAHGYKLANRTPEQVFFSTPTGDIRIFDVLHILQFDSNRKRMSIIVKDDFGKIIVYSKGADSAILTQLHSGQERTQVKTEEQLETFATEGLRTLCIAKKDLSQQEYEEWLENHKNAEVALEERDEKLAQSAELMERELVLLGATGIEDRLQDGVSETIASLRNAGIKVWILTGDKQETAVNIGFSCKLIDPHMEIITVNSPTKSECNDLLDQINERMHTNWPTLVMSPTHSLSSANNNSRPPMALIIDGLTLSFALQSPLDKKFIDIAKQCESVICCRAAPLQKAAVVRLVRENLNAMSLAIGDGANDVSMLQMAEIGVGIAGEEGVQAVMASDFVLGRFRFLQRLLLLHGFWCYDRIARMIVYFFYKNAMFVALLFWYQLFNGFSGSNSIDDISLILYNLVFTSVPAIIAGVFDQNLPEESIIRRPVLYQWGQFGKAYSRKLFWVSIFDAVYQSLVLFFFPYFTFYGTPFGMIVIGVTYHQLAVITATLHIAIETPNFTVIHFGFMLGSVVLSFLYFFLYCAVSPLFNVYWSIFEIMSTSEYWLLTLFCPFFALLPRLLYRTFQATLSPSIIQLVKRQSYQTNNKNTGADLQSFKNNIAHVEVMERQMSTPT